MTVASTRRHVLLLVTFVTFVSFGSLRPPIHAQEQEEVACTLRYDEAAPSANQQFTRLAKFVMERGSAENGL